MTGNRVTSGERPQWPERFEIPELPEWFREPGETLGYIPWQHTPLDPFDSSVRDHQAELRDAFSALIDTPPAYLAKRGLERLVQLDFLSGMTMREAQCSANYHAWADGHPEEKAEVATALTHAQQLRDGLQGYGSAQSQLELLRAARSLTSLDLQVLTTPYGYRRQHLPAMRQELQETLVDVGATVYDEPQWLDNHPPKIATDPARRMYDSADPHGLLVTYKRKLGELPDSATDGSMIEVLERESWLVPTSVESGFSQDIVLTMWREPMWQRTKPAFAAQVGRYVMARIQREQHVVPLAVATYARRTM